MSLADVLKVLYSFKQGKLEYIRLPLSLNMRPSVPKTLKQTGPYIRDFTQITPRFRVEFFEYRDIELPICWHIT